MEKMIMSDACDAVVTNSEGISWRVLVILSAIMWLPLLVTAAAWVLRRIEMYIFVAGSVRVADHSSGLQPKLLEAALAARRVRFNVTVVCLQVGWAFSVIGFRTFQFAELRDCLLSLRFFIQARVKFILWKCAQLRFKFFSSFARIEGHAFTL